MGLVVEDSSCLILTHVLYKAALVFALLRWAFSWALKLRHQLSASSSPSSSCSASRVSAQTIMDSLVLTTYGDISGRRQQRCDTCAVCLSRLAADDEVRELRNCSHVFHRECIDTWVDHECSDDQDLDLDHDSDNHRSCPLCRAPLLTSSQTVDHWSRSEPSWAVDRILYLFGDDLLY